MRCPVPAQDQQRHAEVVHGSEGCQSQDKFYGVGFRVISGSDSLGRSLPGSVQATYFRIPSRALSKDFLNFKRAMPGRFSWFCHFVIPGLHARMPRAILVKDRRWSVKTLNPASLSP